GDQDDPKSPREPLLVECGGGYLPLVQDLVGDDDQLVDPGTHHCDQCSDCGKVQLLDERCDPEQDHDHGEVGPDHGQHDACFTVPVIDDHPDRNRRSDASDHAHHPEIVREPCRDIPRAGDCHVHRECPCPQVDLEVLCRFEPCGTGSRGCVQLPDGLNGEFRCKVT